MAASKIGFMMEVDQDFSRFDQKSEWSQRRHDDLATP
jgi:hypothetical protein